jgi:hypothetical protein
MNSNLSDPTFWSQLQKSVDQEGTRESSLNVIFGILTTTILLALAPQSGSGSDTIFSQPS